MAINQASFFLYPPRYSPHVEYVSETRTVSGEPVEIVGSEWFDTGAPKVVNRDVYAWFCEREFQEKESYGGMAVIYLERDRTCFGEQEIIETSIMRDEEEFEELYIRFLLTKDTPGRISGWRTLIHELGERFNLRLMDPEDNSLRPCTDFYTLLLRNANFADFRNSFNWQLR